MSVLLLGLTACSKSDEEAEQLKSELAGTWNIVSTRSAVYDGQGKELYNPPAIAGQPGDYWIFTDDNIAQKFYQEQLQIDGRYRLDGNSVFVTDGQQATTTYLIKNITSNSLTLELTNPGNGNNKVVHTTVLSKRL
ncbi:lipocalin family protein [Hymenobacter sp. ISL-91]|uniref:lipocalin family protein n=1 Tax=Hymenobacter sp. ISL-91 TaxID=2819151 RepID=UPI001BE5C087|nr:lipocalin family protein [Hymenobacter sp. ISL-91]MBT2556727.1 lipocalin family protein [Hymenobacter sp. ISL-91]